MRFSPAVCLLTIAAMLSGCGDDGGKKSGNAGDPPGGSPTAGCSLVSRQRWLASALDEWYLFPETLPADLSTNFSLTEGEFLDRLTANARAQRKDRYFTFVSSAAEDDAYFDSGATAGLGFQLSFEPGTNRLVVNEAYENGGAFAAGIDRGDEILAIGLSQDGLQNVTDMIAQRDYSKLDAAFASKPGTSIFMRVAGSAGTRTVTATTSNYSVSPISTRNGYRIIQDGATKVGYVNLRTFISTADDQLRLVFGQFRDAGITKVIVDLRYNGGGLLSTAETFTDLLGAGHSSSDVQAYTTYRPSKASENATRRFQAEGNGIAATQIAFIGTGGTASASEYVMNAFIPYLKRNTALIGSNTFGKPVGQIGLDNPNCADERLRVVAFSLRNSAYQGEYYNGLASKFEVTCAASDDLTHQMGDPQEASTAAALNFLAGRSCRSINAYASAGRVAGLNAPAREPLRAAHPNAAQRQIPGLF